MDLRNATSLPNGAVFHLSRAQLRASSGRVRSLEVQHLIWVQNGAVRVAGGPRPFDMNEGALLFLRAGDTISLRARAEETWVAQLSIAAAPLSVLRVAYPELAGRYFWAEGAVPAQIMLNTKELASLSQAALTLESAPQTALSLHAFLLPLLTRTQAPQFQLQPGAPDWLRSALAEIDDPEVYQSGASGFVALTGRAHAHVSRTVRSYLGQSPSELINSVRMTQAARLLSSDDESLPDIAQSVGITNLSHFHRLFRAHHGMTPAAYRQRFGRSAIQPR